MSQFLTSIHPPSHRQLPLPPKIKKIFNVPTVPVSPMSRPKTNLPAFPPQQQIQPPCPDGPNVPDVPTRQAVFTTQRKNLKKVPNISTNQASIYCQQKEQTQPKCPMSRLSRTTNQTNNIHPRQIQPPNQIVPCPRCPKQPTRYPPLE